ncbi:hypothetical protein [Okeania sp. SIO2C2]|nr:hypothetical protein [Okeania sp. SIO2C2]
MVERIFAIAVFEFLNLYGIKIEEVWVVLGEGGAGAGEVFSIIA